MLYHEEFENELIVSNKMSALNFKCGDVVFCKQVDKRVYALNCMFCQQIFLQWSTFINHMEQKHNEELDADSTMDHEDYEAEKAMPPNITMAEQSEAYSSISNVNEGTNQSLLCDPLKEVETIGLSNIPLSNSPVLSEEFNVGDNNDKNDSLNNEISSVSTLSFTSDDNKINKKSCDKVKLTELIIKYYKQHKILWQTNVSGNKNIKEHHKAYKNITNLINNELSLNLNFIQIKGKINKLKSRFRKEHELVAEFSNHSNLTCGNEEVDYEDFLSAPNETHSVSRFYKKMYFLKDYINEGRKRSKRGTKALTNDKCYLPLANLSLEDNRQFIELYKCYPCLWDVNHIGFRFKNQRQESLQELLEAVNTQINLNLSIEELQKKLYSIRYAFTKDKHRKIKNEQEFTHQCDLYNELLFLEDSVGPFKCEYCEQIFNGPDQYKIHKSSHDGSMPYTCPQCNKGFMKVGNCTVHIRRHTKDFQFECGDCGKKFPTSTDLNVHLRRHTGEKPYFCDICGQSFRTWTYFDSHKRRHEKNPSHKCSICLKSFYENNKLKQHMKSHLNLRDKVCKDCGKAFTCTKYLNQHKLTHAEEKKYSCKICGKKFAQYGGLSNHIKSHTTIINSSTI